MANKKSTPTQSGTLHQVTKPSTPNAQSKLPSSFKASSSDHTSKWRPSTVIAVKVIGVAMYRGRLLAAEIYNDAGELKGVRPLGGHIEFGETREAALRREFREELDTEINITGSWRMFENLYQHESHVGHEYILSVGVGFVNRELYTQDTVVFSEDSGEEVIARWIKVSDLKKASPKLFPTRLIDYL